MVVVAFVVVAFVVLAVGCRSFWEPLLSLDEQSNMVYGDQVLAGRVPHRDFFVTYGPANYWVIAGSFAVLGPSVESQRAVGLLYHFAVGAAVYLCCSRRDRTAALAAAVTSVLLLTPLGSIAYAWLAALAAVLLSLAILQRATSLSAFALAGLVGGCSAWWRPEMLVVAGLTAAAFCLPSARRVMAHALGLAVALLPMAVFTAIAGPAWLANILTRAGVDAGYSRVDPYVVLGCAVVAALALAMLGCGVVRRDRMCIALFLLVAAGLPQVLQRPDIAHLVFVAGAAVPLCVAHVLPPGNGPPDGPIQPAPSGLLRLELNAWMVSAVLAATAVGVVGVVRFDADAVHHVSVGDRSVIVEADVAPLLRETVESLTTASAGAPVFIGAQDMSQPTVTWAMLYHLLPQSSVRAYYLEIPPGLDDVQAARLAADVRSARVLLLTEFTEADRRILFPHVRPISPIANVAVREGFCLVGETAYGELLTRCDRTRHQVPTDADPLTPPPGGWGSVSRLAPESGAR